MKFLEMDETVTLASQLQTDERPVILINKFNVKPEDRGKLLEAWAADAEFFKAQPGFISAQPSASDEAALSSPRTAVRRPESFRPR
jgi:hypothetical protein